MAITQQRSDLASREGRALLGNSTIQLFLRNGPDDVAHVAEALKLSGEEVAQITRLVTEKRSKAEAYLVNGERGRGGVTIRLGSHAYWLATSEPVVDVPWRELALERLAPPTLATRERSQRRRSALSTYSLILSGTSRARRNPSWCSAPAGLSTNLRLLRVQAVAAAPSPLKPRDAVESEHGGHSPPSISDYNLHSAHAPSVQRGADQAASLSAGIALDSRDCR